MTQASEELLRLAGRCEKAVFPCPDDASATEIVEIRSAICQLITDRPYDAYSPDYIGSLDAAMTLVPEGHKSVPVCVLLNAINANCEDAWVTALPRFVCAAALRTLANKATPHDPR